MGVLETIRQEPATSTAATSDSVRWRPLLALAGGVTLLLLLTSGRYGYDGDELYFIVAGEHLSWSYTDQGPLIPLLASLIDSWFPNSLLALRAPAAVLTGASVVLTALIARELDGGHRAQLLAAAGYAASPFILWVGHLFATVTPDTFLWTLTSLLLLRWVRTRQDRLLLYAGLCTAVALQVKYLMPLLWVALLIGVLVAGPRVLLRRPMLWVGGALALLSVLPALIWQATHGWPHVRMAEAVSVEQETVQGGRLGFFPWLVLYAAPVGVLLLCCGVYRLYRDPRYRFLACTVLALTGLLLITNGRPYYLIGVFGLTFAAGAVHLQEFGPIWWHRWWGSSGFCALQFTVVAMIMLPIVPLETVRQYPLLAPNPMLRAQVGWEEIPADVSAVYRSLPDQQRANTVVVTDAYSHAAVLEHYRTPHGLPDIYSGNRGYWHFGAPPDGARSAIVLGADPRFLREQFAQVRFAGKAGTETELETGVLHRPSIWICSGKRSPWSETWPSWQRMNARLEQ